MSFRVQVALVCSIVAAASPRLAGQQDLRGIVPEDALAVVEVADPRRAVEALLVAVGDVPKGLPPGVVALLGAGLGFLRTTLGEPAADWADRLGRGGAVFAVMPAGGGLLPLVLSRPPDVGAALQWCERFAGRVHASAEGDLLLLSATRAGCDLLRTRLRAPASRWSKVLLGSGAASGTPVLRGALDLVAQRRVLGRSPRVEDLDGGGRFLLAPLVHALGHGRWLQFDVSCGEAVVFGARIDAVVLGTAWDGLLPGKDAARQVVPLAADGVLLVSLDRSVRALFGQLDRYLPAAEVLAAQSFLSIADALDGANTSFVDDLLGGLREPFALHVLAATPPDDERPPLLLPGIAVSAPIADAAVEPILRRMAQVFVTIANGERGQRGLPPFVLRQRRCEHGEGLVAEAPPWRGPGAPPVESALSPTLLVGNGHAVLATTQAAAEQVLALAASAPPSTVSGDLLVLRGAPLAAAIDASRAVLQFGRMLDEGEDAAAAQRFFDIVTSLAGALRQVSVRVQTLPSATRVELSLERQR